MSDIGHLSDIGGEKMMDDEMTATAVNSQNPLHIPELLDNILGFLPVNDLKSCRLVNKFWKDTALKPMRTKCATIKFGRRSKDYHGLVGMQKFLQCFSADLADRDSGLLSSDPGIQADIPCTKFQIYTGIINEQKRNIDREKLIVANFFQAISPWMTEFTLEEGKDIGRLLKGLEDLNFPSLKRIIFSKVEYKASATFHPWMSVFITNSPQLEKLELTSAFARDPSFFQFLSQNKGLKIKELSIHAKILNNDLVVLSESDLKLKSLTLHNMHIMDLPQPQERITVLSQLLQKQSETLEKFSIRDLHGNVAEGVPFPVMKQLKALTTHGGYPGLINYAVQTPSLEMIDKWSGNLNGEMQPALGVKKICCGWTRPTAEAILQMGRIFPNIRKLELLADEDSLPMVYNSLPNLEELTLTTLNTPGRIDALLTGLTNKGYKQAVKTLRNWTPDFDESGIQIGMKHSPISVLTNLRLLRLRRNPRGKKYEITHVSICLVLMKMPSLQILDLCNRLEAPDQVIPCEVLKEFRKNRVILWKPYNRV